MVVGYVFLFFFFFECYKRLICRVDFMKKGIKIGTVIVVGYIIVDCYYECFYGFFDVIVVFIEFDFF